MLFEVSTIKSSTFNFALLKDYHLLTISNHQKKEHGLNI